jgi:hypothetical protein
MIDVENQQKQVCGLIKQVIRHIVVDDGDRVLSSGTGVVIRKDGLLLTAKHIIADPDVGFFNGKVFVNDRIGGPRIEYQPILSQDFGFNINQPGLVKPINLDFMILKPVKKMEISTLLEASNFVYPEGTNVIIAGFPDDIFPPFDMLNQLDESNPDVQAKKSQLDQRFSFFMKMLLYKHAMIGATHPVVMNKVNINSLIGKEVPPIDFKGAFYWLDNNLTYGGSGGPVVTLDGKLIGIMLQKGLTDSKSDSIDKLPSGSGMAASIGLIDWILNYF